jgi:predicted nucleic acid-binding Zn ribbon protein
MPEYLYACACGYNETIRHGMGENVVVECTLCKVPMTRKPQVGAVVFKGAGFYSTGGE